MAKAPRRATPRRAAPRRAPDNNAAVATADTASTTLRRQIFFWTATAVLLALFLYIFSGILLPFVAGMVVAPEDVALPEFDSRARLRGAVTDEDASGEVQPGSLRRQRLACHLRQIGIAVLRQRRRIKRPFGLRRRWTKRCLCA